jgi:hypothetical protein
LVVTLDDALPRPAVVPNNDLRVERVATEPGYNLRPEQPIHNPGHKDTDAHDAVKVVRKAFVDVLIPGWRHERSDGEIYIAEEEEDSDRKGGADWWVPVVLFSVQVEVYESAAHKDVDYRERIRDGTIARLVGASQQEDEENSLEDEIICITGRRREHNDNRDEPMLEQAGQRRIERLVAGPKPRERKDSLATKLLHHFLDVSSRSIK